MSSLASRDDFRRLHRLRVRWAEVDLQGIVFNGHYLLYLDTVVAEHWRALALPYLESLQRLGGDLYVRKATLDYRASARYDDLLDIGIRCERLGTSSLVLRCAVFRQEQLLVDGELVYVFADPTTQLAKPVPQALRDLLTGYEAGEPMLDMHVGDWRALGADAMALRGQVFAVEQGVPAELMSDAADDAAVHVVAYNRLGMPLASGRLVAHAPGVGKIGRMAVCQSMRGAGVGRLLLRSLLQAARERGLVEAMAHAQTTAQGFYTREGFQPRGAVFREAGLGHIEMALALPGRQDGQHRSTQREDPS